MDICFIHNKTGLSSVTPRGREESKGTKSSMLCLKSPGDNNQMWFNHLRLHNGKVFTSDGITSGS